MVPALTVHRSRGRKRSGGGLGRSAETVALWYLRMRGYRLRHRNWQGAGGELDLVMAHRDEVVFVEVKARRGQDFGGAAGAVTHAKQRHLRRAASGYLGRFGLWDRPCRFDVVTVERRSGFPWWQISHLRDVMRLEQGRMM